MLFLLSLLPLLSLCSAQQTAKLRLSSTTNPDQCLSQVMTNGGKSPTDSVHMASCDEAKAWSFFDAVDLPGKMEYQSGAGQVLVVGEGDRVGTVVSLELGYDGFTGPRWYRSEDGRISIMGENQLCLSWTDGEGDKLKIKECGTGPDSAESSIKQVWDTV